MTSRKYSSRSQQTTLTASLTSTATTATVASGANLRGGVDEGSITGGATFTVVIDPDTALEEIVDVTAIGSNTLTITRGVENGGVGQAHSAGAVVRHMVTGRDLREANEHIENTTTAHGLTLANLVKTTDTGTVAGTMIASGAVGTAKIDDAAVTAAKIGTSAVTATKIADLNVTTGKLADSAVTSAKIADDTIVNADINSAAAIAATKIAGTAVTQADTGTVTSTMIANGTIVNADINSSAQIAYSKLTLTNSILNADINASAGIELSKLATDPLARANHTGTQAASTISDFDTQVRTSRLDQMAAPAADVSMATYKITNLGTPSSSADAATKSYVDTSISNLIDGAPSTLDTLNEIAAAINDTANFADTVVLKTGSTMSGALAMGTNKITGLGDPTNAQDAATKNYIDTVVLAPSNLTGVITSVGNVTSIASQTGTGTKFVVDTSPTLVTPNIGVATATSINGTSIPSSKTLVATDSTAYVVPSQTGNSGKFLTTDGTTSSWATASDSTKVSKSGGDTITVSTGSTVPLTISNSGSGDALLVNAPTNGVSAHFTDGVTGGLVVAHRLGGVVLGTESLGAIHLATDGTATGNRRLSIDSTGNTTIYSVADATTTTAARGGGYMGMPQNSTTTGSYTVAAADAGKHIYSTATRTVTIDSNANLALPIGTVVSFISGAGATTTIAITSDTMYLAGTGTTGSRTLAAHGMATAVKVASTTWYISGNGLT